MALQGSWVELVRQLGGRRSDYPATQLLYSVYLILGLEKLKRYAEAAQELASLGTLQGELYQVWRIRLPLLRGSASCWPLTRPPCVGGNRFVPQQEDEIPLPFALHLLHALLPGRLDDQQLSQDRLYALMVHCRQRLAVAAAEEPSADVLADSPRSMWLRRLKMVGRHLVAAHVTSGRSLPALAVLNVLLIEQPDDVHLWSEVGYVQLSAGDVEAAAATFRKVSELYEAAGRASPQDREAVRLLQQSLLDFSRNRAPQATQALGQLLRLQPTHVTALTNLAVAHVHTTAAGSATSLLEEALHRDALTFLREPMLANLVSLYELRSPAQASRSKEQLAAWAARCCADDLDLSNCRSAS